MALVRYWDENGNLINEVMEEDTTPTEPIPLTTDEKVDTLSNSVSDEWESERIYRVDEYCMSNDTLWKCKIQHNGVKPEEGVYWTKVNMASELNYLASLIK